MPKETTRKCIATGEILNKEDLLRFVMLEDNTVVPDFKKKLPGKGIYVKNAKSILEKAINNNLFGKRLFNDSVNKFQNNFSNILQGKVKQTFEVIGKRIHKGIYQETGLDMVHV